MTQPTSAAQKVEYDFSDLTPTQQTLLTFQGWHALSKYVRQPSSATVRKLIGRGLLIKQDREIRGVIVTEYDVPTHVHIAWCYYCHQISPRHSRVGGCMSHGLSIEEFISDVWQYTDTDAPFTEAEQDDIVELMNSGYTPSEAARSINRQRATSEDV